MKRSLIKAIFRVLVIAGTALGSQIAIAATCMSLSSGTWSSAARWSCGRIPLTTDDVVIVSGHNVTTPGAGTTVGNLTVNGGGILSDGGGTFTVNGNFVLNGSWAGVGAGLLQMNGGGSALSGTGTIVNDTLRFFGGANVITAGTNITISGAPQAIDIRNSTTVTNNGTITVGRITGQNGRAVWTNAANATLNVSQDLLTTGTLNASATGNTVNYNGAAQTVKTPNGSTYYNLILSGSNTKTMPNTALTISGDFTMSGTASTSTLSQSLTVNGNFVLNTGTTFNAGTQLHSVGGNFTNNGTLNPSTGQFLFNGGAAQTIAGATTFFDFEVDNVSGVTLNNDITVTDVLFLTNGVITTGSNSLITTAFCDVSVSQGNGYVAGTLRKAVPTGNPLCYWEIGDAGNYRQVSMLFTNVSTSGDVAAWVSQTPGDHADTIGNISGIDPSASVNRYWTLTDNGIVFASVAIQFTYVAADIDAGATVSSFIGAGGDPCSGSGVTRTCSSWASYAPAFFMPSTSQTTIGGVVALGDFSVGAVGSASFTREREFIYSREIY